jgi:MerR family transcriptional regulator, mercuric resistance operon regulatory protein
VARMTIGGFARAAGVGVETVRYYQRRGLLPVPAASRTAYREYDAELLQRLKFIRRVQAAGFTLAEIRELLRLDRGRDRARVRALAAGKLAELGTRISELQQLQRALQEVVHDCEHGDAAAPCPIIEAFDTAAGHGPARAGTHRTGKIAAPPQRSTP